jgi:hypothetical protein
MTKKSLDKTNRSKLRVWTQKNPANGFGGREMKLSGRQRRIAFLFQLVNSDPVALVEAEKTGTQPGDLTNLAYGLLMFGLLPPPRDKKGAYVKEIPREYADEVLAWIRANPARLRPTIDGVRKLLEAAADGLDIEEIILPGTRVAFFGSRPAGSRASFGTPVTDDAGKGLAQLVWLTVHRLLDSEEGELVRRCKREACRCIFLASRLNQEFCSRKCANAIAFERYKAKRIDEVGEEAYRAEHAKAVRNSQAIARRRKSISVSLPPVRQALSGSAKAGAHPA